jgi:hypothetical protein
MKTKLTLATVAVAFAVLAMPGAASAHFDRRDWRMDTCRKDRVFGWMYQWHCKKAVKHKHYVHKKAKKKVVTK